VLQLTTQDGVALRWLSKGGRVAGIKCKRIIEFLFCTVVKGKSSMSLANTLGRGLLANMFIQNGFGAFLEPDSRAKKVEAAGLPQPRQSVILNGALMVLGGTMLAANIAPKLSARVLAACLIPTTFVGHLYWKEENPAAKANQKIHFFKNLAMLGGLLVVIGGEGVS
jgi:putative oxidoreductase